MSANSIKIGEQNESSAMHDSAIIEKHMNSFLDECLTEEKSYSKPKSSKKHRNKNRPSTSLFSKKRKSTGNGLLPGSRHGRVHRAESATGMNKSGSKEKYRPSSAFSTHYVKYKPKSKKNKNQQKINVKTRNTRNHPNGVNASFEVMISELNKLRNGTRKDVNNIGSESFEISKLATSTLASHSKSTNRISKRSNSGRAKRKAEDKKKNQMTDYKILQMFSKEDIIHNQALLAKANNKVRAPSVSFLIS